jgi:hypothetical protein
VLESEWYSTDRYKDGLVRYNRWVAENSSPAAHQLLQAELADMCTYAFVTDLPFVDDYCSVPAVDVPMLGRLMNTFGLPYPTRFKWDNLFTKMSRGFEIPGVSGAQLKQGACNYAKAQGVSGVGVYCQ